MSPGNTAVNPGNKVKDIVDMNILTILKRDALIAEIDDTVQICVKMKYIEPEEAYIDVYKWYFRLEETSY
jgi:hypothetical protein